MSFDAEYLKQVRLLLQLLPLINKQDCFALKGGTAINMFIRNMPRLSVDIDLTYLPVEPREIFLENITKQLELLHENILQEYPACNVRKLYTKKNRQLFKLLISYSGASVKIEPNLVLRGTVFPVENMSLCELAQNEFITYCRVKALSFADLYAGKICAALSRQHPRDLFDIKILLEEEGITDKVRQAFVVYLSSNPRPMGELLAPNLQDLEGVFNKEFMGMVAEECDYQHLLHCRGKLVAKIKQELTDEERKFLLSIKLGEPDWQLLPNLKIHNLPALNWKVMNVRKMEANKHQQAVDKLKRILEL